MEGLSRALQPDEAEHAHLADLVRATNTRKALRRRMAHRVRPVVQQVLGSMTDAPAFVLN